MGILLMIAFFVRHLLIRKGTDMYKAFLANSKAKENESSCQNISNDDHEVTEKVDDVHENTKKVCVDREVTERLDAVWKQIESQCIGRKSAVKGKDEDKPSKSDWQIVRLFVSSTFADFFNEREVLVKKVFPELREWCQERNLKLIECDLRWGVPRDTPSEQTISICLEEIDKCIDVSNGFPLFIGLLGERYGWIPHDNDVSSDTREKYQWVDGTSITSMEILHGAYRTRNPNAAFFLRNSSVLSDIPESHIQYFVDKDPLASYHLKILKEKLKSALPEQIFPYEPKFKQLSEVGDGKEPRVELEGFEEFAKNTLAFLKSAILRIHTRKEPKEIDPLHQEEQTQWLYVLDKANNMIGRQPEKEILMKYLREGLQDRFEKTGGSKSQLRKLEDWDIADADVPLCVVEAPSGWGKTTLVSSVIRDIVNDQKDWKVFYHLVGSTPSSVHIKNLLHRLLSALITNSDGKENAMKEGAEYNNQIAGLKRALPEFRKRHSDKLIIIIDNLNALSNSDTLNHLSWLPPLLPPNIRCIVSTNQHLPTTSRVYEHPTLKMSLSAMTQDELRNVATQYLGTFSKKLHPSQVTALFSKTRVDNPLWLSLMVEELRIFGSFDLMDKRIAEMPTTLDGFMVQVFERLIHEDQSQNLVKKVLCVIASSMYGIPSDKVLDVLGDKETKKPIALLEWLQVKRSLKPYLRTSGFLEEMITFSHDAVHKAVRDHFLSEKADLFYWNTVLADFYEFKCDKTRSRVWNLLYHMKKACLFQRMVHFMRSDQFSFLHTSPYQRSDYLKDCRCRGLADAVIPNTSPVMLCQMCSSRTRGFNPFLPSPNKSVCVVCGAQCFDNNLVYARVCLKHTRRMGPDMIKCFLCNFAVSTNTKNTSPGPMPSPGLLCNFCGFGMGTKTCAVLSCDRLN